MLISKFVLTNVHFCYIFFYLILVNGIEGRRIFICTFSQRTVSLIAERPYRPPRWWRSGKIIRRNWSRWLWKWPGWITDVIVVIIIIIIVVVVVVIIIVVCIWVRGSDRAKWPRIPIVIIILIIIVVRIIVVR